MRAPANVSMIAVAPDVPSSSQVRRTTINYKSLWGGGSFGRLRIFHLGHMATAVRVSQCTLASATWVFCSRSRWTAEWPGKHASDYFEPHLRYGSLFHPWRLCSGITMMMRACRS